MIVGRSRARPVPTTIDTRATVVGDALPAQQVLHDLLAPGCGMAGVGERLPQLVVALQGLREAEQLVLDLAEGALGRATAKRASA